jgi:hypothetical protein
MLFAQFQGNLRSRGGTGFACGGKFFQNENAREHFATSDGETALGIRRKRNFSAANTSAAAL